MSFEQINHEQLQKIISRLDQAIYNHQQWFNALIRTLTCRLPPDQHDLSQEAHKECRFGQWCVSEDAKDLVEHPGFKSLKEAHQRMHQLAKGLLETINKGTNISPSEYDLFSNALDSLRLEIATLKRELETFLYDRDPLTGAINRVNMLTLLREQQEISKREHQSSYIVMIDLDNFKQINELHGHPVGDTVLSETARYLIQHLRPSDKMFRYGGEEFLVCLNTIESNSAFELTENLRKGLAETDLNTQPKVRMTASFGVTLLDPFSPVEQSIERSDKALLTAKSAGKNCTKLWTP